MGVSVKMMTGDTLATAESVATEVGIGPRLCCREEIAKADICKCDKFPGLFPQEKSLLVEAPQKRGCIVGTTEELLDDVPSLRLADLGIAVPHSARGESGCRDCSAQTWHRSACGCHPRRPPFCSQVVLLGFFFCCVRHSSGLVLTLVFFIFHVFATSPRQMILFVFTSAVISLALVGDLVSDYQKPCRFSISK